VIETLLLAGKSTSRPFESRAQRPALAAVTVLLLAIRAVTRTEVPVTVDVTFVAV
jgi:hypothetical protein